MDGVRIDIDLKGLDALLAKVGSLAAIDESDLLTAVGAIGESQTRRRIEEEKTAPDGTAWQPNRKGTSILVDTGQNLLGSIAFEVGTGEVAWGSSWEYADVHQDGMTIVPKNAKALAIPIGGGEIRIVKSATIPARPFVGVSEENAAELLAVVTDYLGLTA